MVLIVCHSPLTTARRISAFLVSWHFRTKSSELGIASTGEEGAVTGARFGTKSSFRSSRVSIRYFTATKPKAAVASSSPVSVKETHQ
jgi:hypothetical protein